MRIGKLRHSITIERYTETTDEFGQSQRVWSSFATRHANIEPLFGVALERAKQIDVQTTHRLTIRHAGITPDDRVQFGSRTFNVLYVLDVEERGIQEQLYCIEVS